MHTKALAAIFLVLGIIFIAFNRLILAGIQWVDKKTRNEQRRKQFPGWRGRSNQYKPWMVLILGVSWIACAMFFWLTSH